MNTVCKSRFARFRDGKEKRREKKLSFMYTGITYYVYGVTPYNTHPLMHYDKLTCTQLLM